jgi:AraC-like DNA-binding protein
MTREHRVKLPVSEALRPFIESFSLSEIYVEAPLSGYQLNESARIDFILEGRLDVGSTPENVVPLAWPVVHGPASQARYFKSRASKTFSVNLTPVGWSRFWSSNAADFADSVRPLSDLTGMASQPLRREISGAQTVKQRVESAENYFLGLLNDIPRGSDIDRIFALHALIENPDTVSVEQISDALEMGNASLVRLCRRALGFAPKLLLSRKRFFRMLEQLEVRPYGEWRDFLDPHYVDQSHFIRDFNRFTGMAPRQFMALAQPCIGRTTLKLAA